MKNSIALNDLKDSIIVKEKYGKNGYKFRGFITYFAFGKVFTEILDVFLLLGDYEPTLNLDMGENGDIIKSDKFHLDFNIKFNTMIYSNNLFTIEGKKSPKMGDYKVTISEHI